jgi:hypothetical protein
MIHVAYILFGALLVLVPIATCGLVGQLFISLVMKGGLKYTPIGLLLRVYIGVGVLSTVAVLYFIGFLALT